MRKIITCVLLSKHDQYVLHCVCQRRWCSHPCCCLSNSVLLHLLPSKLKRKHFPNLLPPKTKLQEQIACEVKEHFALNTALASVPNTQNKKFPLFVLHIISTISFCLYACSEVVFVSEWRATYFGSLRAKFIWAPLGVGEYPELKSPQYLQECTGNLPNMESVVYKSTNSQPTIILSYIEDSSIETYDLGRRNFTSLMGISSSCPFNIKTHV